ncbi:transposase, partial [Staphylococcus aureus]|uniref:ATP-binding protein n=1 Tax=Staphylococcus aureus TaxID=1280 RepID=UPI000DB64C5E
IGSEDAKLFFQLIDLRYEKKSTIFTTNINFNLWNEIFDDPKIENAILDRILHHSSVVKITGKSYRLKDHSPKKEIT